MCVLFGAQDVLCLINDDYTLATTDAPKTQRVSQKEMRNNDQKAFFYIYQCVDMCVFEKIVDATTTKAV